jgi:acyl-CoA thioesterase I
MGQLLAIGSWLGTDTIARMNPVVLFFASGESLYVGASALLILIAGSPYLKACWILRCRNIAAWISLAMIALASPPFPWMVWAVFVGIFLWWLIGSSRAVTGWVFASRPAIGASLVLLLLAMSVHELIRRRPPTITGTACDHLVVIGDSISSGIGLRATAWPVVMQQMTGIPVTNLALPGAGTSEAVAMARKIVPGDCVVLVEIGGNDLLSGVSSNEFEKSLDAVLARTSAPGRTVVMFELPLLPNKMEYGQIQRRLSAKFGVGLIPKRFFANVLSGSNATSDGLHLSDVGAHRMASLVAKELSTVLKSPSQ